MVFENKMELAKNTKISGVKSQFFHTFFLKSPSYRADFEVTFPTYLEPLEHRTPCEDSPIGEGRLPKVTSTPVSSLQTPPSLQPCSAPIFLYRQRTASCGRTILAKQPAKNKPMSNTKTSPISSRISSQQN